MTILSHSAFSGVGRRAVVEFKTGARQLFLITDGLGNRRQQSSTRQHRGFQIRFGQAIVLQISGPMPSHLGK